MKTGFIYTNQDELLGVNVSEDGKAVKVNNSYYNNIELNSVKAPVVGYSFDMFITKTVKMPKLSKDELKKTVELQIEFLLGENAYSKYLINTKLISSSTGNTLFIVAGKIPEDAKKLRKSTILPSSLGMLSFAVKEKLINEKKSTMLIHAGADYTNLVVITDKEIVFMRTFSSQSDLNSEIRLSRQAVYLQAERCFIEIDEYVIFYLDDKIKKELQFNEKDVVKWRDISEYTIDEKDYFLPVGLSLYSHAENVLKYWNIAKKPPTTVESLRRSLFFLVPVFLIFLPVYYYADFYQDQQKIDNIENDINRYSAQLRKINVLTQRVAQMRSLMLEFAEPCLEYAKFYNVLSLINEYRAKELWLTNISGKVSGELVITGYSQNFKDISIFIKKLDSDKFVKRLNLNYSSAASSGKVSFQMTLHLTSDFVYLFTEDDKDFDKKIEKNQNIITGDAKKLKNNNDKNQILSPKAYAGNEVAAK